MANLESSSSPSKDVVTECSSSPTVTGFSVFKEQVSNSSKNEVAYALPPSPPSPGPTIADEDVQFPLDLTCDMTGDVEQMSMAQLSSPIKDKMADQLTPRSNEGEVVTPSTSRTNMADTCPGGRHYSRGHSHQSRARRRTPYSQRRHRLDSRRSRSKSLGHSRKRKYSTNDATPSKRHRIKQGNLFAESKSPVVNEGAHETGNSRPVEAETPQHGIPTVLQNALKGKFDKYEQRVLEFPKDYKMSNWQENQSEPVYVNPKYGLTWDIQRNAKLHNLSCQAEKAADHVDIDKRKHRLIMANVQWNNMDTIETEVEILPEDMPEIDYTELKRIMATVQKMRERNVNSSSPSMEQEQRVDSEDLEQCEGVLEDMRSQMDIIDFLIDNEREKLEPDLTRVRRLDRDYCEIKCLEKALVDKMADTRWRVYHGQLEAQRVVSSRHFAATNDSSCSDDGPLDLSIRQAEPDEVFCEENHEHDPHPLACHSHDCNH
ncbi:hypothetical protein HDE_08219 [Halotydeus destructor]|nr:hypothetical protein HDE_08219 [Halotydeus destructor]